MFGVYDYIVQKRQHQVIEEAERAKQIVSELFPRNVKDRLFAKKDYKDNARVEDLEADNQNGLGAISSHTRGSIMTEKSSKSKSKALTPYETKPIADLFVSYRPRAVVYEKLFTTSQLLAIPCLFLFSQIQLW